MRKYETRGKIGINGEDLSDFKNFKEAARELRSRVDLMNKTGYSEKTPRYGFSIDYVVPAGPRFDFDSLVDGTVVLLFDSGVKVTYTGATVLTVGEASYDAEAEDVVQTIEFMSTGRVEE